MIVIVSGTNRPGSNTRKVTARVEASYQALGVKTQVLDLAELPPEIFAPASTPRSQRASRDLRMPSSLLMAL